MKTKTYGINLKDSVIVDGSTGVVVGILSRGRIRVEMKDENGNFFCRNFWSKRAEIA